MTNATTHVDDYLPDLGPDDADITSHDTYTAGVPHATFARLRREDPVHWTDEQDGSGFWSILKYADALRVSRDVETFTSTKGIRLEEMDADELAARQTLMELDPPEHTRYRRLVSKGFTGRMVATYADDIRQLAIEVIETALEHPEFDFVHDIAEELPMRMLGTTARHERRGRPQARDVGRCAARQHRPRVHRLPGRSDRHRSVPDGSVPQPGLDPDLPVRATAGPRSARLPTRRHHQPAAGTDERAASRSPITSSTTSSPCWSPPATTPPATR